jgi:hypothetical protein
VEIIWLEGLNKYFFEPINKNAIALICPVWIILWLEQIPGLLTASGN